MGCLFTDVLLGEARRRILLSPSAVCVHAAQILRVTGRSRKKRVPERPVVLVRAAGPYYNI